MDTNAAISQAIGVHTNTAGLYAKKLAAAGYITSTQSIEVVGDSRFAGAGRAKLRRYALTDKGKQLLGQA